MKEVGTSYLRTHLAKLLDQVELGERLTITRRGKAVAMLVPQVATRRSDIALLVREMLANRDNNGPSRGSGITVKKLVDEGRR
jgi:prevent-host-death family protein